MRNAAPGDVTTGRSRLVTGSVFLCRIATGIIFLYASLDKLAHPQAFAQMVYNYRLLPLPLLHPFALLLPATEATVGVALVLGFWRRGAALLASGMTITFIVAIGFALVRGLDISCGCFDTEGGHGIGLSLLLRDLALLAMALAPLLAPDPGWGVAEFRADRPHTRP